MRAWRKTGFVAAAAVMLVSAAPDAKAAYLDPESWVAALSGPVAEYGTVSLTEVPVHSVMYQDAYGTWTPETQRDAVYVGPDANPYNTSGYASRGFYSPASPAEGQLAASFTCHSFYYACLGAFRATFTLPFEIIGFTGSLKVGADYWPPISGSFMPELEIAEIIKGTAWKFPGTSFFYGQMFDAPTNTFTVSWTGAAQTNLDAFASFRLSDAMVVRAVAVPEPASAGLLGIGLLGLAMARRGRGQTKG